jgi:hypothetical protein
VKKLCTHYGVNPTTGVQHGNNSGFEELDDDGYERKVFEMLAQAHELKQDRDEKKEKEKNEKKEMREIEHSIGQLDQTPAGRISSSSSESVVSSSTMLSGSKRKAASSVDRSDPFTLQMDKVSEAAAEMCQSQNRWLQVEQQKQDREDRALMLGHEENKERIASSERVELARIDVQNRQIAVQEESIKLQREQAAATNNVLAMVARLLENRAQP